MVRRWKSRRLTFGEEGESDELFASHRPGPLREFWRRAPKRSPIYPVLASGSGGEGGAGQSADQSGAATAEELDELLEEHWLEIELVDEAGEPVPGVTYEVQSESGGPVKSGRLNANGFARIEGLPPGSCKVCFPDYDASAWQPA